MNNPIGQSASTSNLLQSSVNHLVTANYRVQFISFIILVVATIIFVYLLFHNRKMGHVSPDPSGISAEETDKKAKHTEFIATIGFVLVFVGALLGGYKTFIAYKLKNVSAATRM